MSGTGSVPAYGIETLSVSECWRLIDTEDFARLAVIRGDGTPDVFPLNYLAHRGNIYVRTAPGSKLRSIVAHPEVALELDGEHEDVLWSVVVHGTASRVVADAAILAAGADRLVSDQPEEKPYVVRITPIDITGRRFRRPAPAPDDGQSAAASPGYSATRKPKPIAAYPPPWVD